MSEMNTGKLQSLLVSLNSGDFNMEMTGLEMGKLEKLLASAEPPKLNLAGGDGAPVEPTDQGAPDPTKLICGCRIGSIRLAVNVPVATLSETAKALIRQAFGSVLTSGLVERDSGDALAVDAWVSAMNWSAASAAPLYAITAACLQPATAEMRPSTQVAGSAPPAVRLRTNNDRLSVVPSLIRDWLTSVQPAGTVCIVTYPVADTYATIRSPVTTPWCAGPS